MVHHFHVLLRETVLFVKRVHFDQAKISRWHPSRGFFHHNLNDAALDVTNQYEKKDYVEALELTFDLHWLLQVGGHGI